MIIALPRTGTLTRTDARVFAVAAATLCAVIAGAVAVQRPSLGVLATPGVALAAIALTDWRRGVVAMLVLLPFSGVPVFIAGTPGQAFRDVALVLPLYAAFSFAMLRDRVPALPAIGIALPALVVFAGLVALRACASPSVMVAAIGAKVWLAYLPMLAVGFHYVRRIEDFDRALRVTALLGLIPAVIAIFECAIASRGEHATDPALLVNDFGPFRYLYGDWYENVRHSVVSFYAGGGHKFIIARVPSTFTSSTQFQSFALVACAAGLSQAMRHGGALWIASAALLSAGALASGARITYVAVPALTLLSFVLAPPRSFDARMLAGSVLVCGSAIAAAYVAGVGVLGIAVLLPGHVQQEFANAGSEFASALRSGLAGHGTGWDTPSALRYGHAGERRFIENWYAKIVLELGPLALLAMLAVFASLHLRTLTGLRRIDAHVRQLAAPVCALLLVVTVALFKGPFVDLDPLNVYFWLLAGMLLSVVQLPPPDDAATPEAAR